MTWQRGRESWVGLWVLLMIGRYCSDNGLVPSGNKPLSAYMLTKIYVSIWRQWATWIKQCSLVTLTYPIRVHCTSIWHSVDKLLVTWRNPGKKEKKPAPSVTLELVLTISVVRFNQYIALPTPSLSFSVLWNFVRTRDLVDHFNIICSKM